ncbi:hypothetical protein KC19_3G128900 [Ceratodon purpureus]|uniref:Carbonic anhydrase n=1 Tax=Ceratodon purpureus TaxID=3225 RepID=A0A8T0IKF1_CERPU|nr:hypothetical protein KC19_3G128900 [Ceratodon purpureus]
MASQQKRLGSWTLAVFLCVHISLSIGAVQAEERFDYGGYPNGPDYWGKLDFPKNKDCSDGKHQSPMMITPNIMVSNSSLGNLDAHYSEEPVDATIKINEGYGVELTLNDSTSTLQIDGITYRPAQMHFHMGSEHKLLGHSFPMELHIVHVKKNEEGVVTHRAVVAFLFAKGKHDNPFLAQFVDKLPLADSFGEDPMTIDPITYPKLQKSYARYQGSLTTPPCSEGITWTVMLWDFPTISERQLELFKAAMPTANARPLQNCHERKLEIHTDS